VSAGKKEKGKELDWLLGSKEKGSAQVRNRPARVTARLDGLKARPRPNGSFSLSLSLLQAGPAGRFSLPPLTSETRSSAGAGSGVAGPDPVWPKCACVQGMVEGAHAA